MTPPSAGGFAGQPLLGWGLFNLAEWLVDQHRLDIHRVRGMPAHVSADDWLFLAVGGVGLVALAWLTSWRTTGARPARR